MVQADRASDFASRMLALPDTWMQRQHFWSSLEEKELKAAIDYVLEIGVNSLEDLLLISESNQTPQKLKIACFLVFSHLHPKEGRAILVAL